MRWIRIAGASLIVCSAAAVLSGEYWLSWRPLDGPRGLTVFLAFLWLWPIGVALLAISSWSPMTRWMNGQRPSARMTLSLAGLGGCVFGVWLIGAQAMGTLGVLTVVEDFEGRGEASSTATGLTARAVGSCFIVSCDTTVTVYGPHGRRRGDPDTLLPTFDMLDGDALWDHDAARITWAADGKRFAVSAPHGAERTYTYIAAYDAVSASGPQRLLEPFDARATSRTSAARAAVDGTIRALLGLAPATGDDSAGGSSASTQPSPLR